MLHRKRYSGKFKHFRDLLSNTQWYSPIELEDYQNSRLRDLIRHAYNTVPYYNRVFKRNKIKPDDIKTVSDLPKIPVLTRNDIKLHANDLKSTVYKPSELIYGHTSGTTGSPLQLYYNPDKINISYAALDRQYQWAGARLSRFGDRIAVGRGNVIVPLSQRKPPFWRHNYFHNQLLLSSFHLSRENLPSYFEKLKSFKPSVIDGYPSTLYILAKFLQNMGQKFPLKAVISASETLYDFQRNTIEDSFQCKIFDYYTLAEWVVYATECEKHEGHHLNSEYGVTEIVDQDNHLLPKGKIGKIVGTSLHNYGMPMIRYLTNDMTAFKHTLCSCGRGLPLMEDVTTKAEDTLTLKDGRLISPSVLTHPFKPLHSVEESQIIQKDYSHIVVKIVPRDDFCAADEQHLTTALKSRIGTDTKIDIQIVESLPRTSSGKFRWVISEVPLGI